MLLPVVLRKIPVPTSDEVVANSLQSVPVLLRQGDTTVYIYS
jgi:hypothetical protein